MRTPKINSKKLAAALAPIALAGAVMAPAAAASTHAGSHRPVAVHSKVGYSRGFHIYNLSSNQIRLSNITGDGNFEGRPADGSVLKPGESTDVEVQFRAFSWQRDDANYQILDDGGNVIGMFRAHMEVDFLKIPYSDCQTTVGWSCSPWGLTQDATTIVFEDAPGTVHNLSPSEKEAQAQALKQLCVAGSAASCTFTPTKEDRNAFTAEHPVGNAVVNHGNETDKTDLEWGDTVDVTDSYEVGAEVGANILDMVDAKVTATYGHDITKSHEFKQTLELDVDPGYMGWVTDTAPVIRDWGNFTVTMGNTTWNLTDVYFDSPDPSRNGTFATYTKKLDN